MQSSAPGDAAQPVFLRLSSPDASTGGAFDLTLRLSQVEVDTDVPDEAFTVRVRRMRRPCRLTSCANPVHCAIGPARDATGCSRPREDQSGFADRRPPRRWLPRPAHDLPVVGVARPPRLSPTAWPVRDRERSRRHADGWQQPRLACGAGPVVGQRPQRSRARGARHRREAHPVAGRTGRRQQ